MNSKKSKNKNLIQRETGSTAAAISQSSKTNRVDEKNSIINKLSLKPMKNINKKKSVREKVLCQWPWGFFSIRLFSGRLYEGIKLRLFEHSRATYTTATYTRESDKEKKKIYSCCFRNNFFFLPPMSMQSFFYSLLYKQWKSGCC